MWCKLDDIAYVGTGATPLTACKYYYENGNIAWINSSSTKVPFIAKASNFITQKAIEETNCLVYPKGTLVIAMYGEGKTRGQISELLIDAATNQACAAVRPYSEATKKYLKLFFEGNYLHIRALAEGGNQQNLSVGKIQNYEIPLPPLDEQKRILDKAKELLLQIDNIEVGKSVCQKYINQAKSKVLDLAIHGKLVSQDPNDEPAIELLKRINPKAEITCDTPQYGKLPKGWCLCRISSVVDIVNGKSQKNVESPTGKYPIYGSGGIIGKAMEYTCLAGSTIIGRKGTINHPIFVEENFWNVDTAFGMKANNQILEDKYFYCFCLYFDFSKLDKSSALPSLTKTAIGNLILPIPPLAEQQRIVARIEELFAQLDKIESSLQV
ncbi:restriction endonuclease subunit S [Segatella copri]|uniref:restriction endonuclease subunit S n=1 Tax=Segatella copri TaxID=165179 RepID=UPI001C444B4C|nr:restriction endonuclease subunit S [Segatella copri]WOZ84757.1 restriction endonuclease subunit S [Segatella copri]